MNIILVLLFALIGTLLILFMVTLPYCFKCRGLAEDKNGKCFRCGHDKTQDKIKRK